MLVVSIGLLLADGVLVPLVALAVEVAIVPLFGIGYGLLLRRGWPLLVSAAGVAVAQLLFGTSRQGAQLVAAGFVEITEGTVHQAITIALRILAVALPGVLVFAALDPTDFADSLVQQLRVSPRFAIGALAALRLLPLLRDEWYTLTLARRARGVDAGRNPIARARLFWSTLFSLLVSAIRRATRLATAMDARGFDSGVPRTFARPQRVGAADVALVVGAVGLAVLAVWAG